MTITYNDQPLARYTVAYESDQHMFKTVSEPPTRRDHIPLAAAPSLGIDRRRLAKSRSAAVAPAAATVVRNRSGLDADRSTGTDATPATPGWCTRTPRHLGPESQQLLSRSNHQDLAS